MTWTNDKNILKAYEEAKATLEMEGVFLPEEVEKLLRQKAKGLLTGPEFRKKVLKVVTENE